MTRIPVISLVLAAAMLTGACSRGSSSAAEPASGAAPNGRGSDTLVSRYCTGCHAPPRPQARAPGEWTAVVARMQEHRIRIGMSPIPAGEMDGIIAYLQGEGGEK